jgi:hypothetical protein
MLQFTRLNGATRRLEIKHSIAWKVADISEHRGSGNTTIRLLPFFRSSRATTAHPPIAPKSLSKHRVMYLVHDGHKPSARTIENYIADRCTPCLCQACVNDSEKTPGSRFAFFTQSETEHITHYYEQMRLFVSVAQANGIALDFDAYNKVQDIMRGTPHAA